MKQKIYQIFHIIKIIINLLVQIYQDKKNTNISQQINFTSKLEDDDGAKMLIIDKKQQKTILKFSVDLLIVIELHKLWNIKKY